jgi:hypothetical protein
MPGYAGDKERVLTRLRRIEGQVRGIGLNRSKRPPLVRPAVFSSRQLPMSDWLLAR